MLHNPLSLSLLWTSCSLILTCLNLLFPVHLRSKSKAMYHLVHDGVEIVKNEVYGGVVTLNLDIPSILLPLLLLLYFFPLQIIWFQREMGLFGLGLCSCILFWFVLGLWYRGRWGWKEEKELIRFFFGKEKEIDRRVFIFIFILLIIGL